MIFFYSYTILHSIHLIFVTQTYSWLGSKLQLYIYWTKLFVWFEPFNFIYNINRSIWFSIWFTNPKPNRTKPKQTNSWVENQNFGWVQMKEANRGFSSSKHVLWSYIDRGYGYEWIIQIWNKKRESLQIQTLLILVSSFSCFSLFSYFNGSPIPIPIPTPILIPHIFISMADLKPLHVLLIIAPLLILASQLNLIFAHTDSSTPSNLPQQTTNEEEHLPSSDPHLSPPLSNQRAARNNKTKAHPHELAGTKISLKRLRSSRDSIRKRRRRNHQRAWRRRNYSSHGCRLTVSLSYIWFGIFWSILHNLIYFNSPRWWRSRWRNVGVMFFFICSLFTAIVCKSCHCMQKLLLIQFWYEEDMGICLVLIMNFVLQICFFVRHKGKNGWILGDYSFVFLR